jgi:hypothetical protein
VSAERILDKERANLCDYYAPRGDQGVSGSLNRNKEAKDLSEIPHPSLYIKSMNI